MIPFSHPNLLAAIHTACPELMELKFGCEVKTAGKFGKRIATLLNKPKANSTVHAYCTDEGRVYMFEELLTNSITEILGREPQLHDVLRAIGLTKAGKNIIVSNQGGFYEDRWAFGYHYPNKHGEILTWDLTTGLYGQTTEVLDFLESLLAGSNV